MKRPLAYKIAKCLPDCLVGLLAVIILLQIAGWYI